MRSCQHWLVQRLGADFETHSGQSWACQFSPIASLTGCSTRGGFLSCEAKDLVGH